MDKVQKMMYWYQYIYSCVVGPHYGALTIHNRMQNIKKVQKPSNSECYYTPWSEPFIFYHVCAAVYSAVTQACGHNLYVTVYSTGCYEVVRSSSRENEYI
jgi:hypothetical protein